MRAIAFFSQEGGCGKTAACVNLAAAFASRTFNTLETFENSIAAAPVGHTPPLPK